MNDISFSDLTQMARAIGVSKLFGQTPEQTLALMLVAQAEGRHPAIVVRDYHVIQGRPALKADAMLARFQESGGRVQWHAMTDQKAEATFSHPRGGEIKLSWTLEMAKRAGLTVKPGPWQQYPRAMLRARLLSEGIRTVFPEVVCGVYTPEEVMDIPPLPMARVEKDITPPPEPFPPEPVDNPPFEGEPDPGVTVDDAVKAVKAAFRRVGSVVLERLAQEGLPASAREVTPETARAVLEVAHEY